MEIAESHSQYSEMLRYIVTEIKSTRVVLAQRVNSAMMTMYWNIGKRLSAEKLEKGYGANVVKRLSADLQQEFPDTTGFSPRNLWNMKNFYVLILQLAKTVDISDMNFTLWLMQKCSNLLHFCHVLKK